MKEIRTIHANLDKHQIAFGFRHENGDKDVLNLDLRQLPETVRNTVHMLVRTTLPDAVRDSYELKFPPQEEIKEKEKEIILDQGPLLSLVQENLERVIQFGQMDDGARAELRDVVKAIKGDVDDPHELLFD